MARLGYPQAASDLWFLRAYAWALYDHVKKIVTDYEAKRLAPSALSGQISSLMREFSQMAEPLRRDTAFSQMLRLAGTASKDWKEFLVFARWAGVEDFADEDKVPFVTDQGKTVDSLQHRFTRAICRETAAMAATPQTPADLIAWGEAILAAALQARPNDQWLNYYQSKLHLARGETDFAVKHLTPVLRRQITATWPWALLGEILEVGQPDDALTCYAHAVELAREEQEIAKVRVRLANRLASVGRFKEAALQASLARSYREQHGFKLPQDLMQLLDSDWCREAFVLNTLEPLPSSAIAASQLLQRLERQTLRYTVGVIDHVNVERALSYVATGPDAGVALTHRGFPHVAHWVPGTLVEVGLPEGGGRPLDCRLTDATTLPGLCETFIGQLERRQDENFAFVLGDKGRVFVPPSLAAAFAPGRLYEVECLAIWRTNKQGKTGWRAARITERGGAD